MIKLIFGFIAFAALTLLFVGAVGWKLIRGFFTLWRSASQDERKHPQNTHRTAERDTRSKVFGKHEGEYVDFEEVS